MQRMYQFAHSMNNLDTGTDCERFSHRLAANGQTRSQSRHYQRYDLRPGKIKICKDLRCNCSRCRTGHNATYVADHIIADGADPLGVSQQCNRLLRTRYFSGGHGVKGFFISGCYRHTDHIKNNTDKNNCQQDQKRHRHSAVAHDQI